MQQSHDRHIGQGRKRFTFHQSELLNRSSPARAHYLWVSWSVTRKTSRNPVCSDRCSGTIWAVMFWTCHCFTASAGTQHPVTVVGGMAWKVKLPQLWPEDGGEPIIVQLHYLQRKDKLYWTFSPDFEWSVSEKNKKFLTKSLVQFGEQATALKRRWF